MIQTDSQVLRDCLISKDSKFYPLYKVIARICILALENKFRFYVHWAPRERNMPADALSNLDIPKYMKYSKNEGFTSEPFMTCFTRHPANFEIEYEYYTKSMKHISISKSNQYK